MKKLITLFVMMVIAMTNTIHATEMAKEVSQKETIEREKAYSVIRKRVRARKAKKKESTQYLGGTCPSVPCPAAEYQSSCATPCTARPVCE